MANDRKFFYMMVVFLTLFIFPKESMAEKEPWGLWVECEGSNQTLSSKKKIDELLILSQKNNFNALYVQIYRGNRCWYDSDITDKSPFLKVQKKDKIDLLAYLLEKAHEKGIAVHAWMNMFRIAKNLQADMLKMFGPEIINVDSRKRSLRDYKDFRLPSPENQYYLLGTAGYWLDPGNLNVQNYLLGLIAEVLKKYPALDGIHLDMIRNPYFVPYSPGSRFSQAPSFGYGKASVERFQKKTGLNPFDMTLNSENTQKWDDFRRDQVTNFVRKVYKKCRKISPSANVSTAVLCWADRAYLSAFQDWRRWLEEKIVDSVVVMNYGKDTRFVKYLSQQAISASEASTVYIGLGAYLLLNTPNKLMQQVKDVRDKGGEGIVFFSYDAMLKNKKLFSLLQEY